MYTYTKEIPMEIDQALEDIKRERLAREEEDEFLDICFDLLAEGIVDDDDIEDLAHAIMDDLSNG
jgi:hypothetical protein